MQKYRTCVHTRVAMAWKFSCRPIHVRFRAWFHCASHTFSKRHSSEQRLTWVRFPNPIKSNLDVHYQWFQSNTIRYMEDQIRVQLWFTARRQHGHVMERIPSSFCGFPVLCVLEVELCAGRCRSLWTIWKGHMSEKCLATCRWQLGIGYKNIDVFLGNNIGLLPSSRPAAFYTPSKDYTSARS